MLLENLTNLGAAAVRDGFVPPAELAAAFGWESGRIRSREVRAGGLQLDVARGYTGVQPAALFASSVTPSAGSLDLAALYGYHASVRWGVFADGNGLTPFNSHWLQGDRWFRMPTIRWNDVDANSDLLSAFQPRQLIEGLPDRLALDRYSAPTLLQPVDDELVERLDRWRDQALKGSRAEEGVDEQLQTLFAKLFVLRTIEDRNLAPNVPTLRKALSGSEGLNYQVLADIFEKAQHYVGSELFDVINLSLIPEHVIAGVVRDLYFPRKLKFPDIVYNFSWIDSDVLGLAYEKYLSTILQPSLPVAQMDFFRGTVREVDRISVRKAGGVYYTPQYLTKYLADKCVDDFFEVNPGTAFPRVVDFACGSGSFLVAALDALLRHLKATDPNRDWGRELIDGGYISGVDIDEKAVTVARLNLWNRLAEEPNPLPLPNLSAAVVKGDGLDQSTWSSLPRSFDIVLGNPPFLATSRVGNREILEQKFETAKGRYDFSYLFVEHAISVTAPSGTIGMVIPNRLFRNHNGSNIRAHLTAHMDLMTLVDFGSNEVFQGTSAYVGCIVARHRPLDAAPASTVRVVDVRKMPEQFIAAFLLDAETGTSSADIRVYEAQHPRGGGAWSLLSVDEKRAQVHLTDLSVRLGEVAGIFQGIRTGANDVFILNIETEDDRFGAQITNGLGDSAILELGLLEPVVFGGEVRRYDTIEPSRYLLYPYENGVALSEAELEKRYPLTHRYLVSYREILSGRTSITSSGLRWYELVRRRDIEWLRKPKLLIRDLSPETAFAVDPDGGVFNVGGTAVVPESEDILYPLLGYLNSQPVNLLMKRLTPQFKGGFQKFEPQHLQQIPVIRQLLEDVELSDQISQLSVTASDASLPSNVRELASLDIDKVVIDALAAAGINIS